MRHHASSGNQAQRRDAALETAEQEAAKLREIVRLKREERIPYEEGMRRVGWLQPHSSFRRRLDKLSHHGSEGLLDQRHPPAARLTGEIRGFIVGLVRSVPRPTIEEIRKAVSEQYKESFSVRTVRQVLHDAGLAGPSFRFSSTQQPSSVAAASSEVIEEHLNGGAGLVLLTIADDLTGYTKGMAQAIEAVTAKVPAPNPMTDEDRAHRDWRGRFLPEYNAPRPRRDPSVGAVFESVETKRLEKDLGRMQICSSSLETLQHKLLAMMALPAVTNRGHFDGATDVRGTFLAGLEGIDYMPETLSKAARELKFAGVSRTMIEQHARIWYSNMRQWIGEEAVCSTILYVDATTKPLWTDQFHKSGRVAMLGRVMPCVETVLINTGAGVPLYMKTYSGNVSLVKNVLPLIEELEQAIGKGMLGRLSVMDGEMDCVALFKQFDAAHRYFITPLDASRVTDLNQVEGLRPLVSYRDGDWIGGGWVSLNDSHDPDAPPYRTRAIVLERRTKETITVFATSAPAEEYPNAVLMDVYFQRWPAQEGIFRQLNMATAFKGVHGYGKMRVLNVSVVDEIAGLQAREHRLVEQLDKARLHEKKTVARLHKRQVEQRRTKRSLEAARHHQKLLVKAGKAHTARYAEQRTREEGLRPTLKIQSLLVAQASRNDKQSHSRVKTISDKLSRNRRDRQHQENRTEILQTDTELDQIFSVLKLGFLLLTQFLIARFFNSMPIDLMEFVAQIFLLPGQRIRTATAETIRFEAHRRNPKMMLALEKACERINALHHEHDGRVIRLEVSWPSGRPDHAG